jgi:hypothetical protein
VFKINGTQVTTVSGSGSAVLASSPTLVTPNLGAATATTINKVVITPPASSATLTIANGKTATINNTLTLVGADSSTLTFQGTDTYVGRATSDILKNKTLTDPTNAFPGLGLLSLSGVVASGTSATCLGPGGGTSANCAAGSASDSAALMPAATLRSMRCRTAASFSSGRSWTFFLRKNGTDQTGWGCTFNSSSTSCTLTPSGGLTLAEGDLIDLRSTGNVSQAPSGRMTCSLSVGF